MQPEKLSCGMALHVLKQQQRVPAQCQAAVSPSARTRCRPRVDQSATTSAVSWPRARVSAHLAAFLPQGAFGMPPSPPLVCRSCPPPLWNIIGTGRVPPCIGCNVGFLLGTSDGAQQDGIIPRPDGGQHAACAHPPPCSKSHVDLSAPHPPPWPCIGSVAHCWGRGATRVAKWTQVALVTCL